MPKLSKLAAQEIEKKVEAFKIVLDFKYGKTTQEIARAYNYSRAYIEQAIRHWMNKK